MPLLPAKFTSAEIIPFALFTTAALYILFGFYSWQKRLALTVIPFAWTMLAMAWWSLGYGLEIQYQDLPDKIFWAKAQYPGIMAIPVLWLEFALEYTGRKTLLTQRNRILVWILPVVTLALVWTNELHHLIWLDTSIAYNHNLTLLHIEHGAGFWISAAYNYALIIIGSWLLIMKIWETARLYQAQSIILLIAILIPLLGNLIYLSGLLPGIGVDLTLFLFIPTSVALTWGIARYRLLTIIPPAQAAILHNLQDSVLVVDTLQRVLYMNRAAEKIFSKSVDESLGQPIDLVCTTYSTEILHLLGRDEKTIEIELAVEGQPHQFELHVSPVYPSEKPHRSEKPSYLIVFHDITQRKEAEIALLRREAILKAVSTASEYFLKTNAWERNIPAVLEKLGKAANVSRAYIFVHHISNDGTALISQRYEWVDDKTSPQIDNPDLQNMPWLETGFARWAEAFEQHQSIVGLVRQFPESERELLAAQQILSIVVMPIFSDDKTLWGFIGFDECSYEREWDEAELDALRTASGIFGAALIQRNIQTRLLKRQQTLDLMQEILHVTLGQNDLYEMGQFLVDHLGALIGADGCFLTLWDEDGQKVIPLAAYGEFRDRYHTMKVQPGEKSFTASVLETGNTLVIDNARDSNFISHRIAEKFPTVSGLAVPMISNEKKLGAVLLGFNHPHEFSQDEIAISEQATSLVALTVAKFQAMEQARHRAEESETLRKAGAAVAESLDMKEATSRILEQLSIVLPHDSASVQLLRDGELEIIGEEGFKSSVTGMRFPIPGDNPNTRVIETRQPYLLHEANKVYSAFLQPPHDHIRSWLGVPLIVRDEIVGLLAIDSKEPYHFTSDDIELVSAFADHVAIAIENARLYNETQRLAITDGLTGLFNRRHFLDLAQREFERARRYKRYLSAMIFDIDHFKRINDTYGHQAGDEALRTIANLCRENMRETDPLGRYGGEEFIGLFIETNVSTAQKVAERLRRDVEAMTIETGKGIIQVTASIGLAEQTEETPDVATLIARADQAMYIAKHKGRNRVAISV